MIANMGYTPTNRRWAPELEISGLDAPAETFRLDPSLPPVGIDPKFPTDMVVIPRGRLVGVDNKSITSGGTGAQKVRTSYSATPYQISLEHETMLTLADGKDIRPLGFAGYNMYLKANPGKAQWRPAIFKNRLIQVPYFKALTAGQFSNSAFGDIAQGDPITAYPGYKTGSTATVADIGKIVKWVPKTVYGEKIGTPSGTILLSTTYAPYSCFEPSVLAAITTAGLAVAPSLSWNATVGAWQVTGAAAIQTVIYSYGQDASQIAGNALGLESFDDDMPGWLKWVTDNYGAWDLPRLQRPGYTTAKTVTGGTTEASDVTAIADGEFRIGGVTMGQQIAGYKPIRVILESGCIYSYVDANGETITATADGTTPLPRYVGYGKDETIGMNYSVDVVSNVLHLYGCTDNEGNAIEATDIHQVTFYYIDVSSGVAFDSGQMGLTEANNARTYADAVAAGIPPAMDVPGSVGILRVMIN